MPQSSHRSSNIKLERLSKVFDLSKFKCGDNELDDFLVSDALKYQKTCLANTTLMIADEKIVNYFSLAADSIRLSTKEKVEEEIHGDSASGAMSQKPCSRAAQRGESPSQRNMRRWLSSRAPPAEARAPSSHRFCSTGCSSLTQASMTTTSCPAAPIRELAALATANPSASQRPSSQRHHPRRRRLAHNTVRCRVLDRSLGQCTGR